MERSSLVALFRALEEAGARYLVAGGMAVLAHGVLRLTADVDLVLDLEPPHPEPALRAFSKLGLRPLVPVSLEAFGDATQRDRWIHEKNARVLPLGSERHSTLRVDLFLEPPLDFRAAHARRHRAAIAPGVEVSFVSLEDLLALKRAAGRPQDLADIERLERIRSSSRQPG